MERILVTGGAGYIGSHMCVELIAAGYDIVVIDNFCNSRRSAIPKISKLAGKDFPMYDADVRDKNALSAIFTENKIDAVIHFAGLKAVGESVAKPLEYYSNNIDSTLCLLSCMREYNVKRIIFSSSATVYGAPKTVPVCEDAELSCTNPYGWTKYMSEQIIRDLCNAQQDMSAVLLRYFNPVGAHESGEIGDESGDAPNNLMPYIDNVAVGIRPHLNVFGNDYDTPDGTGVRDYIHVTDLARGHIAALDFGRNNLGCETFNLGTGKGSSVLEIIHAYENANGIAIPYVVTPRRPGDVAECYADTKKAKDILNWEATHTLQDMCRSSYNRIKNKRD